MARASCLCGGVVWEADGPFDLMSHCHCSHCRKVHGTPFATYVGAPRSGFRMHSGSELVRSYESSPGFLRPFCSRCGSVVPEQDGEGEHAFMPAGCLDDAPGVTPVAHIFVASKASWYEIPGDLPRFDAYPPGFESQEIVPQARPQSEPGRVRGSCLCDAVAFEVEGALPVFVLCHCSRCRKARSAAHGCAGFVEPASRFRWVRGEDDLEHFKVPDAERFTHVFCRTCGSSMPCVYPERVIIAAGAIDGDPAGAPRVHIFVGSKAPWFEIADELPQFAESVPRPD